ncbi:MAG TPA: hypothetical protein VFV67_11890 [Actinophytocola sp.]|uniref:hypothetical protein n=1 Tax=Actinophytocola sp. TaxID=1872138 RepID=UPI002DBF3C68|nr:hypothetical protein [Actinophytocola sp.]HEU5471347.1 hypothetical protein [Actinophytocola sp.]
MRTQSAVLAAVLTTLLLAAPPAAATTPASAGPVAPTTAAFCLLPGPSGWTRIEPQFDTCASCNQAGQAGVARGDWPRFHCGAFPIGLDVVYYLYLPPTS